MYLSLFFNLSHIMYGVTIMNRRIIFFSEPETGRSYFALFLCGTFFICGCIVGTLSAGLVADGSNLEEFISGYIRLAGEGIAIRPEFLSSLFNAFKYHLAVLFFSFSVLGVFLVPALSAVRGFFLTFSISALIRLFGSGGIVLALALFGLDALITIPCFFILSVQSFSASLRLFQLVRNPGTRLGNHPYDRLFFIRCGVCFALLSGSALIETFLTSYLVSFAASHLS